MQTSDKQRETEYLMDKHSWIGRTKIYRKINNNKASELQTNKQRLALNLKNTVLEVIPTHNPSKMKKKTITYLEFDCFCFRYEFHIFIIISFSFFHSFLH